MKERKVRSQIVDISEKEYTVKERTVNELTGLFNLFTEEADKAFGADKATDISGMVTEFISDKMTEVFPGLAAEDIGNAYPSEIEEMVGAFITVNFTGLKKMGKPLLNLILQGMKLKSSAGQPAK